MSTPRRSLISEDFNYDSSDSGASGDELDYRQPLRKPWNRVEDTESYVSTTGLNTSELERLIPPTNNWKTTPFGVLKFVDDFLRVEKLRTAVASTLFSQSKATSKIHAKGCQDFFDTVSKNAQDVGMSVNPSKTQLLLINSALHTDLSSFVITDDQQTKINSCTDLKILGFTFGTKPTVHAHLGVLMKKFRARIRILRRLQQAQIPRPDLVRLYQVLLLPVLDYAAVVYHSLLNTEQTDALERLQAAALRIIYGFKMSYREMLLESRIETLYDRRLRLMDKFLEKTIKDERFLAAWFPRREFIHHNLRCEMIFEEKYARTHRLYNSPLYFMRRRLNEVHLRLAQDLPPPSQ